MYKFDTYLIISDANKIISVAMILSLFTKVRRLFRALSLKRIIPSLTISFITALHHAFITAPDIIVTHQIILSVSDKL